MTCQLRTAVFFFFLPLKRQRGSWSMLVFATADHGDIRGSMPHHRDPSEAASDYKRGFGPQTYRIELSRVLLAESMHWMVLRRPFELSAFIRYRLSVQSLRLRKRTVQTESDEVSCRIIALGSIRNGGVVWLARLRRRNESARLAIRGSL